MLRSVELGWSEGFFAETAGALAMDDSFFRHSQGEYEERATGIIYLLNTNFYLEKFN